MGVNTSEAQKNLNDSLQLLSMGIVPDSIGLQPKLLLSFKDFSDDDRRLDAAYRRQASPCRYLSRKSVKALLMSTSSDVSPEFLNTCRKPQGVLWSHFTSPFEPLLNLINERPPASSQIKTATSEASWSIAIYHKQGSRSRLRGGSRGELAISRSCMNGVLVIYCSIHSISRYPPILPMFQLKYERAGSRANKLLKPVGVLLPEAKDDSLLLGGKPNGSNVKLLEASPADEASFSKTMLLARDGERLMDAALSVDEKSPILDKNEDLDGVSVDRGWTPLQINPLAALKRFRRKTDEAKAEEYFAGAGPVREFDQDVVIALVARPLVFSEQLAACTKAAENEIGWQNRSIRAADALLCSTEPIIDGLDERMRQNLVFLEELREVARAVQHSYILAEINETVEAADAHHDRVKELSSNVADLAATLKAYLTIANAR